MKPLFGYSDEQRRIDQRVCSNTLLHLGFIVSHALTCAQDFTSASDMGALTSHDRDLALSRARDLERVAADLRAAAVPAALKIAAE